MASKMTFTAVMEALQSGKAIRRSKWESITKAFIEGGQFVCQRGDGAPYSYDLSWYELTAKDWSIVGDATV